MFSSELSLIHLCSFYIKGSKLAMHIPALAISLFHIRSLLPFPIRPVLICLSCNIFYVGAWFYVYAYGDS